jgi:hypothetical protein
VVEGGRSDPARRDNRSDRETGVPTAARPLMRFSFIDLKIPLGIAANDDGRAADQILHAATIAAIGKPPVRQTRGNTLAFCSSHRSGIGRFMLPAGEGCPYPVELSPLQK